MFVIYQIIKANLVPVILAKRETAHSYSQDQTYRWDEFCECLFELCTLCEAQALVKLRSSWRVAQRPSFHEGLLYQAKSVTVSLFNSVMFGFLCSTQFVLFKHRTTQLSFLHQNAYFIVKSFTSLKSPDNSSQQQGQEEKLSFRVLPHKLLWVAPDSLHFENTEKPDSVLNLLRKNGFTNTQISKFVRSCPQLLLWDVKKPFCQKLNFSVLRGLQALSSLGSSLWTQYCWVGA